MKSNPTPTLPLSGEGAKDYSHASYAGTKTLSPDKGVSKNTKTPPPDKGEAGRGLLSKNKLHNPKSQINHRRENRKNPTEPEKRFWSWVRGKQLGCKFRRQQGIGQYIVDFYCAEYALVIELDGDSHYTEEGLKSDAMRTDFLRTKGFSILRFTNQEVMNNKEGVLSVVIKKLVKDDHNDC